MPSPESPRASDASQPLAGIVCLCLGLVFFSAHDAVIKSLTGDYSVLQLLMMRSLTATPILGLLLWWRHGIQGFATTRTGMHAIRCLCLLCAFMCFYAAVSRAPLADAVALFGAAPLFITALAGPVLGERVGIRRWSAVCVGFVGVLTMLRPGTAEFNPITLLAAIAAVFYAGSALTTRLLGRSEPSVRLAVYSNVAFVLVFGTALAAATIFSDPGPGPVSPLWHPYVDPMGRDLWVMLAIGLVALGGFLLVPRAYQIAPASTIAPFEYTYLVWAMLIGYAIFDEVPRGTTLLGAALVVSAGIYIARREGALSRRADRS